MKVLKTKPFKDRLLGHKSTIIALSSPYGENGRLLYSASIDGSIRSKFYNKIVWDLVERKISNKLILSKESEVKNSESIESEKNIDEMKIGKEEFLNSGEFSENMFIGGYNDGTIIGWSLKNGERLYYLNDEDSSVTCLRMINSRVLGSGSVNGKLYLWDFSVSE